MKISLSSLICLFLLLLRLLPCTHSGGLFFTTHSSRPWSQHQQWGLFTKMGLAMVSTPKNEIAGDLTQATSLIHPGISSLLPFVETLERHSISNVSGKGNTGGQEVRIPASHGLLFERSAIYSKTGISGLIQEGNISHEDVLSLGGCVKLNGKKLAHVMGLILWLLVLFYLLGTTASDYFSCILEKLSDDLNLSPAVAGVTLLAIGNGAPDVFASVIAFASSDQSGSIGFGSVLGGALFITTIVSGTVSLATSRVPKGSGGQVRKGDESSTCKNEAKIDGSYGYIMENGSSEGCPVIRTKSVHMQNGPWPITEHNGSHGICIEDGLGSACDERNSTLIVTENRQPAAQIDAVCFVRDIIFLFLAVGVLTGILVDSEVHLWEAISFLCIYPVYAGFVWIVELVSRKRQRWQSSLHEPLLHKDKFENLKGTQEHTHLHHQHHVHSQEVESQLEEVWEDPKDGSFCATSKHWLLWFYKYCIEWPLSIPRQLTIPVVEQERWSRKLAITSCTLAPVFVAVVWVSRYTNSFVSMSMSLGISSGFGLLLGVLAYFYTEESHPPQRCLTLWLAGGFLTSITWFYLVSYELVTSLESMGNMFGISTAVLGLTVLAWGNSVGDFVADLALACSGPHGVQIAVSGCYAGPLFNMVVGLGISLVLACSYSNPGPYLIADKDGSLFYIIGFLALGLIWALLILPLQQWRLGRFLGIGLITLYCSFLVVAVCYLVGWVT